VIVSAKHGQSPIDVSKRTALDDGTVIAGPIGANFAFDIGDDGVLIWLKDNSGSKTADAVAALNTYQQTTGDTGIVEWLSGPLLSLTYQDPAQDARTPDIIGIARVGVIYTGGSKIAEHGGLNEDDTRRLASRFRSREHQRDSGHDSDRADHPEGSRPRSRRTRWCADRRNAGAPRSQVTG
jgi:hypothetical protein